MSAELILLSALLVGVPISLKYILAFEMRNLVSMMKAREREVESLSARLTALDREYDVVTGAAEQVRDRQKWAATRRDRMADRLVQVQRVRGNIFAQPEFAPARAASLVDVGSIPGATDFVDLADVADVRVAATAEA